MIEIYDTIFFPRKLEKKHISIILSQFILLININICGGNYRFFLRTDKTMASAGSVFVAPSYYAHRIQLPIFKSARAKYSNKGTTSQSICHSFNSHQSFGIGEISLRQKGRARGKRVLVEAVIGRKSTKRETVIPSPDYRIPVILSGIAGVLIYKDNLFLAVPIGLLGLLLFFQTTRVRFVFDDEALEVKVGDQLKESGENVFVGGKNRWKYSTFINWELWWPKFPILVYFKERQTKIEGQIHFFPVIFNGKQLYDVMVERAGPSKGSSPK